MSLIGTKFSLWRQHGARNSGPVFDAFEAGCKALGLTVVNNSADADVDVIWSVLFHGRMAPNKLIWERAQASNKPVIVLEVGGINRGTTWKVGVNGINNAAYFGPVSNDDTRSSLLETQLQPHNTRGENILICCQHDKSLQWKNMPIMHTWLLQTIAELQSYSQRHIVVRPHPRCPITKVNRLFNNVSIENPVKTIGSYDDFAIDYSNVHVTVSWSSNPGVHSIISGVPAIVGPQSLAYSVGMHNLSAVEQLVLADRTQWFNDYAYTEWTLAEISLGIPLKRLTL